MCVSVILTGCASTPVIVEPIPFKHPNEVTEPVVCPKVKYKILEDDGKQYAAMPLDVAKDRLACESDIVRFIKEQRAVILYYRNNVK